MTELVPAGPQPPACQDTVSPGTADRILSGIPASKAPLLTRTQLHAMVETCDPATLTGNRDRLLLVVLRALGGRPGDAAVLAWDNVLYWPRRTRIVDIWVSVPAGSVYIPAGEYTDHEPSELLLAWREALWGASCCGWTGDGLVFRAITKHDRLRTKQGMTPPAIRAVVKRAAERAGLPDAQQYSAASLARR